jgi:hypothetical protein
MGFKEDRDIYRKTNIKEYEEGHIPGHKLFQRAEAYLEGKEELEPVEVGAIAYGMKKGPNPGNVLLAARLYDSLGKKRKVRQLLDKLEVAYNQNKFLKQNREKVRKEIDKLKRNNSSSGLEGITMLFALSVIAGLTLSISSTSTTGYAISNVTQTSQGLAGIFLFVIGLAGLVFSLKKK